METETARNLPAKLVSLRKQKGITQMELAEKLNVSRQAISRWEVGLAVPTTDNLKVLSELYGVSIDYLLNDAAENVSKQNEVKQDQSSASETEEKNGFRNRRRWYIGAAIGLVLMAIILAVVVTAIATAKNSKGEQSQVMPITDLTVAEETDYTTYTFSFELSHLKGGDEYAGEKNSLYGFGLHCDCGSNFSACKCSRN